MGRRNARNIVYIHSHDTGRCVSPYGFKVATPHVESLAREGVVFRHAYSAAPTCSPSRAALLTSESAHAAGMLRLAHHGGSLARPERHLARVLSARGYHTVLAGMQHVAASASEIGYDELLVSEELPPW